MAADYSKILQHPNSEEIVSKLMTGVDPKDICDWLKLKYDLPEQSHLKLSPSLLKSFYSDGSIDMYNTLKKDLAIVKNSTSNLANKNQSDSLKNNKTYKQKLEELASVELDAVSSLKNLVQIAQVRLEQMFDIVQSNPQNTKPDYVLLKYIEAIGNLIEKYHKAQMPSETTINNTVINNTLNVQYMEDNLAYIQEAIRETCEELDPDIAFLFMDKLSSKMKMLKEPKPEEVVPVHKMLQQTNNLKANANFIETSFEEP
jgi:hypothetical protein